MELNEIMKARKELALRTEKVIAALKKEKNSKKRVRMISDFLGEGMKSEPSRIKKFKMKAGDRFSFLERLPSEQGSLERFSKEADFNVGLGCY